MPVVLKTVALLFLSNIFMTFAWYAHLRNLSNRPWIIAALISWVLFRHAPDGWAAAGMGLIAIGGAATVWLNARGTSYGQG